MKALSLLALVGTLATVTTASAEVRHPDAMYTILTCRDARPIADAGYVVSITTGGIAGITIAHLSEQTFAGPRQLAAVAVDRSPSRIRRPNPNIYAFVGQDFSLTLSLDDVNSAYEMAAVLNANVKGEEIRAKMLCMNIYHSL